MTEVDLPAEFDPLIYRSRYTDIASLADSEVKLHFDAIGIKQGRCASQVRGRADFVKLIAGRRSVLEIGPYARPMMRGQNVRYFDVLSNAQLRERAKRTGLDPEECPQIDFVSPTGDLGVVEGTFDAVVSSHAIEHQVDLIHHLSDVARILRKGGLYYLAIPDKRYCFDHYIAESNIAEVIAASVRKSRLHEVRSIVEHLALTTHNHPARHWEGDHGEPAYVQQPALLEQAVNTYLANPDAYIDVHAWQFIPESFRSIMGTLQVLGWSPFKVARIYPTLYGANEFLAVLERDGESREFAAPVGLPADFDAGAYLLANPDVAKAGVDAVRHYLQFGRAENRRLR